MQKKFCKKMFKIWFQSRFLLDGKPFYLFLTLKLNLSKALQMFYLIFSHGNFYRENEQTKTGSYQTYNQGILCHAKISNFKSVRSVGKTLSTILFKPSKISLLHKESRLLLQILEPDHISVSSEISICYRFLSLIIYQNNYFYKNIQ